MVGFINQHEKIFLSFFLFFDPYTGTPGMNPIESRSGERYIPFSVQHTPVEETPATQKHYFLLKFSLPFVIFPHALILIFNSRVNSCFNELSSATIFSPNACSENVPQKMAFFTLRVKHKISNYNSDF